MPRYILIDNYSGYIFGDTANMDRRHVIDGETVAAISDGGLTPALAARWVDETEVRSYGRQYEEMSCDPRDGRGGYDVYRADVGGSDAVTAVIDGQDDETIEAVKASCRHVAFVAFRDAAKG